MALAGKAKEGHMAWGNNLGQHFIWEMFKRNSSSSGEELWRKSPVSAVSADAFKKWFLKKMWNSCPAFLHEMRRRKKKLLCPLSWRNGGIGHNTRRCQQKVAKTLGLEQYLEMGSPSLGSSSLGPMLKTEEWVLLQLALKWGRNSWCCLISGLHCEKAHSAFDLL